MLTHRWQKGMDRWEKEKWNDFRLGPRLKYYTNPNMSLLLGFYLIVAKFWVVFNKKYSIKNK